MHDNKIAIIDDDPFVVAHLSETLTSRLADVHVVGVAEPVAPAGFDVYVVDNEFEGDSRGQDIIRRIRKISPQSLILAYSAYLDRKFLRALLRQGCEGAFDKGSLEELEAMINIIELHLDMKNADPDKIRGLGNTVRAISGLVHEWNVRLASNGRADVKTIRDA